MNEEITVSTSIIAWHSAVKEEEKGGKLLVKYISLFSYLIENQDLKNVKYCYNQNDAPSQYYI